MRSLLPVLAAAVLLLNAGAALAAKGHGSGMTIMPAPPMANPSPPQLNQGTLDAPNQFGTPPVNSGMIAPVSPLSAAPNNPPSFGALPGSPGSATYDPNGALPSLDNPGSALAPTPGTSAAGFRSPSTNSPSTNSPSTNSGG